ncbi:growth-regulating factor 1-like isoform X1 [Vicia villosa]|uniref:growth-regulating factor 1-like isoform X1 n=1 Tax=Vicia villosa TaxID=3911 RepID=UPI00273BB9BD|nr:growth-regulating factor 1-like isoform X1 [Vicia villosa]
MNKNKFPFTPSQWQELEHQALVYKYMASGISIPPDLLFTIRKSFLDSPISSRLLPNSQHHFGWNYLQMGLGRKIDPEPGRCRRTDGKKWRCSKEAYPDSKYCERHMHRGKNRSRKPVEVLKTTSTNNASSFASSSITKNSSSLSFDTQQHQNYPQNSCYGSNLQHSFMYPQTTSRASASSGIGLSFEDNNGSLFLDSNSCSQNNGDYRNRYVYGQKEEVDEYAFFKEPSGSTTMKSFSASSMEHDPWQLTPLTMSSSSSSSSLRQRSFSSLSNDYSCLQLQSLNEQSKQQEQEEPQKIVHRFFDELPHKGRDQWLDLDDKSSTTQLSISIPSSAHDFPTFTSRNHHDG